MSYLPLDIILFNAQTAVVPACGSGHGTIWYPKVWVALRRVPLSKVYPSHGFGVPGDVPIGTTWRVRLQVPLTIPQIVTDTTTR